MTWSESNWSDRPASQKTLIDKREPVKDGNKWTLRAGPCGREGRSSVAVCVEVTVLPSGKETVTAWSAVQGLTFSRAEASEKAM